jgi:hypothetical protein
MVAKVGESREARLCLFEQRKQFKMDSVRSEVERKQTTELSFKPQVNVFTPSSANQARRTKPPKAAPAKENF